MIHKGNNYKYDDEFEGERLVDTLEALEDSKKYSKKTLVYSPKLRANILVFNNRLVLWVNN